MGQRQVLERYRKKVYRLDLEAVRHIQPGPGKPRPEEVLEAAMQSAADEGATLVIQHFEVLRDFNAVTAGFREKLAAPGRALVIGIHELDAKEPQVESAYLTARVGLNNIHKIGAPVATPDETRKLIFDYYVPRWEKRDGYTFTHDAFDHIIALEPGAFIHLKRMTLPYLTYALARGVINDSQNELVLHDTINKALQQIDQTQQKERETVPQDVARHYDRILDEARREIAAIEKDPMPKASGPHGLKTLTQAHVTAELICPNTSEFRYPKPSAP